MPKKPFVIGTIIGAHGVRGDLKVFPLTDEITRFEKLKTIRTVKNDIFADHDIERVWYHKKFVMLKLLGIDTPEDGLELKDAAIEIDEENALPLSENEYYIRDLYGMDVFTEEGARIGEITNVIMTGANDVYEIDKKILIPAIKQCIQDVDVPNNKMTVRLMEGLL